MDSAARELALARATARATMTRVLRLVTINRVADGMGGSTESAPTLGTATVCRIMPVTAKERELGGRISAKTEYRVFCPYDFAVTSANRVQVDGVTYEIQEALSMPSDDAIEVVLGVSRIT